MIFHVGHSAVQGLNLVELIKQMPGRVSVIPVNPDEGSSPSFEESFLNGQ